MATAPPSGMVLDRAAPAVFDTAASRTRRPGRETTIGGQLVARLTRPIATEASSIGTVTSAAAEAQSPLCTLVMRYQTARMTMP